MYPNNLQGEEMEAVAMENPGIKKAMTIEQAFWQSKKEAGSEFRVSII